MTQTAGDASAQPVRRRLTRPEILAAAVRIVDRDGLEGLNMRVLGQELGVQAMSIYHHISGKDGILDGVVEMIYTDLDLPAESVAASWRATLKDGFTAFRRLLLAHPAAVPLFATRSVASAEAMALIERSLRTLRDAGFDDVGAIDGHRVLMSFTIGYAMSEVSLLGEDDVDPNSWGTAAYARQHLPRDEVPHLAEVAAKALARHADEQFEACLETIVAGLARRRATG
jgi:TetR/AcrR family tetracycline transcriptional repressor